MPVCSNGQGSRWEEGEEQGFYFPSPDCILRFCEAGPKSQVFSSLDGLARTTAAPETAADVEDE
jgi:hypothetical protein